MNQSKKIFFTGFRLFINWLFLFSCERKEKMHQLNNPYKLPTYRLGTLSRAIYGPKIAYDDIYDFRKKLENRRAYWAMGKEDELYKIWTAYRQEIFPKLESYRVWKQYLDSLEVLWRDPTVENAKQAIVYQDSLRLDAQAMKAADDFIQNRYNKPEAGKLTKAVADYYKLIDFIYKKEGIISTFIYNLTLLSGRLEQWKKEKSQEGMGSNLWQRLAKDPYYASYLSEQDIYVKNPAEVVKSSLEIIDKLADGFDHQNFNYSELLEVLPWGLHILRDILEKIPPKDHKQELKILREYCDIIDIPHFLSLRKDTE